MSFLDFFSPVSPITVIFYLIASLWGSKKLHENGLVYKKASRLRLFIDAALILGIIYILQDILWLSFNTYKWAYAYPEMIAAYSLIYPRNLLALFFLGVCVASLYGKQFSFTSYTFYSYVAYAIFLGFWFLFASNPALTNWAYAIRNHFHGPTIVFSFVIGNLISKIFFFVMYWSVFK